MHRDAKAMLWDARRAGQLVQTFIDGKSLETYRADALLRSGVERQLAIVGEALNRLSTVDSQTASAISDLPRIVSFRNILVHGYASVDDNLVWQLVETRLPKLLAEIDQLLEDDDE